MHGLAEDIEVARRAYCTGDRLGCSSDCEVLAGRNTSQWASWYLRFLEADRFDVCPGMDDYCWLPSSKGLALGDSKMGAGRTMAPAKKLLPKIASARTGHNCSTTPHLRSPGSAPIGAIRTQARHVRTGVCGWRNDTSPRCGRPVGAVGKINREPLQNHYSGRRATSW